MLVVRSVRTTKNTRLDFKDLIGIGKSAVLYFDDCQSSENVCQIPLSEHYWTVTFRIAIQMGVDVPTLTNGHEIPFTQTLKIYCRTSTVFDYLQVPLSWTL